MDFLIAFLAVNWIGICITWAALLATQRLVRRRRLELSPLPAGQQPEGLSALCAVIPARNEQTAVIPCLNRLLHQDYGNLRITVVDDRSEDATARQVACMAEVEPRLDVRRVLYVPSGWLAKSHALWVGTRDTTCDWLLFVDADCTLHPAAVRTALAEAIRRDADGLTLWPRNGAVGFWEHMLIPLCAAVIAMWFGARELRRPGRSGFANGQFLLIRRDAYERIGGHAAVRSAIIEDIPLAEIAARHGLLLPSYCGRELLSVRMYDSFRGVWDGWSRIYVGALRSGLRIVASVMWLAAGSLLPFVILPAVLWQALRTGWSPTLGVFLTLGLLHLVLLARVSIGFWRLGGCRLRYLWLYPISTVVVVAILLRAWWLLIVRCSITWRQTRYAIDRRGRIVA